MFLKGENVLSGKTLEAYACQVVFVLKRKKVYKKVLFIKRKVFWENKNIWDTIYRMNNLMSLGKKDLAQVRCE